MSPASGSRRSAAAGKAEQRYDFGTVGKSLTECVSPGAPRIPTRPAEQTPGQDLIR